MLLMMMMMMIAKMHHMLFQTEQIEFVMRNKP